MLFICFRMVIFRVEQNIIDKDRISVSFNYGILMRDELGFGDLE